VTFSRRSGAKDAAVPRARASSSWNIMCHVPKPLGPVRQRRAQRVLKLLDATRNGLYSSISTNLIRKIPA
jgi:hypothetical protein